MKHEMIDKIKNAFEKFAKECDVTEEECIILAKPQVILKLRQETFEYEHEMKMPYEEPVKIYGITIRLNLNIPENMEFIIMTKTEYERQKTKEFLEMKYRKR